MSTAENVTPEGGSPFSDSPTARLPRLVAGLSHREIAIRARGIIAAADQRFRASGLPDPWDRRMEATGVLSADDQRILIAATRLNSGTIADDSARCELDAQCREVLLATVRKLVMKDAWQLAKATGVTSHEERFQELVALGESAVLEHIDTFDLTAQASFATYIRNWTRQVMQRHTYLNSNPAKVPEHVQVAASRLQRIIHEFRAANMPVTVDGLASQMSERAGNEVSRAEVQRLLMVLRGRYRYALDATIPLFDGRALEMGHDHVSAELQAAHRDDQAPDPATAIERAETVVDVRTAIDRILNRHQAKVVRARYGIDRDELSAAEIQQQLNLSKGTYDGIKDRAEIALALDLAMRQRPEYLSEAMSHMEPDDATALRLAHGLDFAGNTVGEPADHAAIAENLGIDQGGVARVIRRAERQAATLMTRVLPTGQARARDRLPGDASDDDASRAGTRRRARTGNLRHELAARDARDVRRVLRAMSAEGAEVFRLACGIAQDGTHTMEPLATPAIAAHLGIPERTVRTRLAGAERRGLDALDAWDARHAGDLTPGL